MKKLLVVLAVAFTMARAGNASAVVIDFDSLDTSGGPVTGSTVTDYLASYGITTSSLGTLVVENVNQESPTWIGSAPSSPNEFSSWGTSPYGDSFTLYFSSPVDNFSLTRSGYSGTMSQGSWSATAYDASNTSLGSVGEGIIIAWGGMPMQTFTLGYNGISYITFSANAYGWTGVQMPWMDNLTFTPEPSSVPEPSTLLLLGSGMIGLAMTRIRKLTNKG